jgi:hypothetical protein
MPKTITQKVNLPTDVFKTGLVTTIEAKAIPRGAAQSSLNWMTKGDRIELRRGCDFIGDASVNNGVGKATGLRKVTLNNGNDRIFGTYGKKLKWYDDVTTNEWVEIGSDLLGNNVVNTDGIGIESISLEEYVGLAGNQLFINSSNISGYYKIMVANPTSYTDMYDSSKNWKGLIKIDTNRTLLWQRIQDQTGIYGSRIDAQAYTTVSAEVLGTGNGAQTTFTGTLAFKGANPKNTAFGISVTDGVETFRDDYNGTLIGSLGGTGTINYTTGAISVTFNTAVTNLTNITVSYQHEDSNNTGISDFTKSTPRQAAQGFVIRQDEGGGKTQKIATYNNIYYCFHVKRTWTLTLSADDSDVSNQPYRHHVGIPNDRAAVDTGEGIYYIDETDENDTKVRRLTYDTNGSQQVIPVALSNNININDYTFDQGACTKYGDLAFFAGRLKTSTVNNRVLVYNILFKSWDVYDWCVTCFDTYNGSLIAGDSLSNNFSKLFTGLSDFDSPIVNHWIGKLDDLDIDGLKKTKKFKVGGLIGPDQSLKFSVSIDNGPYVEIRNATDIARTGTDPDDLNRVFHLVEGDGTYVDRGNRVNVGPQTLGRGEIGGGGDGIEAYNYEREISFPFDKFETVSVMIEATRIGFASVSLYAHNDIRFKGKKVPRKYRG